MDVILFYNSLPSVDQGCCLGTAIALNLGNHGNQTKMISSNLLEINPDKR